jgi:putative ABC transport system permease protein
MRSQDYFRMVSTSLRNRRSRVALTANGVLIGTAAVVLLVSLGIGMQRGVMAQFESIGDLRTIRVSPAYVDEGPQRLTGEVQIRRPLDEAALAEIRSFSGVESVVPRLRPAGYVEPVFEDWSSTANLMGLDVRDLAELDLTAQLGTTRLKRGTVVLGQDVLNSFGKWIEYSSGGSIQYVQLAAEDLLGEDLRFVLYKAGREQTKTVTLKVAGILAGEAIDRNIYVSVKDLSAWNA